MARNWNDMPNEVKFMIVDNMDIVTRLKLKMCSKSDKCVVESVPMHLDYLGSQCKPEENVLVIDSNFRIREEENGTFYRFFNGTYYERKLPKDLQKYKTEYLFKKFLGNLLFHRNLHIDDFETNLDFPNKLSNTTINATEVSLGSNCEETVKWLNALSTKTRDIHLPNNDGYIVKGIGLIPAIINAKKFFIERANDITDEQLLTFKFTEGRIKESQKITVDGAIQFIQHIVNNDYPMDTDIDIHTIEAIEDYEAREDDDEEETRFCLPMNSEKEVVYYYNTRLSRFSIFVQEAGGPVKTYRQQFGLNENNEDEEEEHEWDDNTDDEEDLDE